MANAYLLTLGLSTDFLSNIVTAKFILISECGAFMDAFTFVPDAFVQNIITPKHLQKRP